MVKKATIMLIQVIFFILFANLFGYIGTKYIDRKFNTLAVNKKLNNNQYHLKARDYKSYNQFKKDNQNFRSYDYSSFIGFRSGEIKKKSIKINQYGIRSNDIKDLKKDSSIWIFGGSTVWGYGVSDKETIPYYLNEISKKTVINLGEQAYVSRQSLNFLLNLINDIDANLIKPPSHVIFYDGVNDAIHPCTLSKSSNDNPYIHYQESAIKEILKNYGADRRFKDRLITTSKEIIHLSNRIYRKILPNIVNFVWTLKSTKSTVNNPKNNSCNSVEFAERVTNNLVNNWKVANIILRERGIRFTAILQPSPYQTSSYKGIIDKSFKNSFDIIYPKVIKNVEEFKWFIDGTQWIDKTKEPYFIDKCCHLSPSGNKFIAEKIFTSAEIN